MKLTSYLGLFALTGALASAAACGDSDETNSTGSGGGAQGGAGPVGPGPTSTGSTGGSGGGSGDGNDDFSEAADMTVGTNVQGVLDSMDDYDYYRFTGSAGDVLYIFTDAKPDADPFADGYPDLVLTLYQDQDGSIVQIAENDDPIPRTTQDSRLLTRLPADGTYYLRVGDFCWWAEDTQGSAPAGCALNNFNSGNAYAILASPIDFDENGSVSEAEGTMEYEPNPNGNFYASLVHGTYDDSGDVDTFVLPGPPQPITVDPDQRETIYIDVYPSGVDGNGSTAELGNVWISDSMDPTQGTTWAKIDATKMDPVFGMTLELPYLFYNTTTLYLHVDTPTADVGVNPFYFVQHALLGSNPLEVLDNDADPTTNNDALVDAEPIAVQTASSGIPVFWYAGDIATDTDVDHFELDLATVNTSWNIFGTCTAQRIGSGLRGLTATLYDQNGTPIPNGQIVESPDTEVDLGDTGIPIPSGTTKLVMKVETTATQDANVAGTYYRCATYFIDPNAQ